MLCGALAFAAMAALAHALGARVDWRVIAIARTGLALLFALGLCAAARVRLYLVRPPILWLRSIAGSISLVCTFFALVRLPVGDVLALTNIFPLWIALLSWPVLGVRPSVGVWIAVASGIAGVWLIQQPHLDDVGLAPWIAVAASLSTCVAMMGLHRLHHIDPRAIVVHFSGVALIFCLVSLAFTAPSRGRAATADWLGEFDVVTVSMLLGVGVAATVGQLFLTKAFAAGPPARVSVVALSQVVFGVAFDLWFWQRKLEPITILGIGLVLVPTAWLLIRHRPEVVTEVAGDA
jgi:drug/metabolite transporter (DMT)-like permease